MQCQMFIAVNSTPINFMKIFFDKFLCPHILRDIAALHYITVFCLSVSQCSDAVYMVMWPKLRALIG